MVAIGGGNRGLAVVAKGIRKGYRSGLWGRKEILKGIDLNADEDEIFGILGPNGSGKTTLLSIFSTLIYPDQGELTVLGIDARGYPHKVREKVNISTGKPNFPWSLSVEENLRHSAMLYGLYGRDLAQAVEDALEAFDLYPHARTSFDSLSTGLKQRLSLAKAMLNRPRLLFLDEPTTGLDPDMALKTREMILRVHREEGVSVMVTTHYMPEAEQLCQRIAFMKEGSLVAQDTPANMKRALRLGDRLRIRYRGEVDLQELTHIPGVICADCAAGRAELVFEHEDETVARVLRAFCHTDILDIKIEEPDLEDVFLELAR